MTIPDFQSLMLPFMIVISDRNEHTSTELVETLADEFKLNQQEREVLLPSGRQRKFDNRVGWAKTHLQKACLVESTGRGKFRITQRGTETLQKNPPLINMKFLLQFPEFVEFRKISRTGGRSGDDFEPIEEINHQTPEELLEISYQSMRGNLAQDLLDRIKKIDPRFFEHLVVDLLLAMGYGGSRKDAGKAIGQSGDGGIDGIIKEDKLGLDVVYIQAKRQEASIGRPIIQAFAGSLEGQRARKGVFITTSKFTNDAKDYIGRIEKKIVLIDGQELAQLMIDHNVGVTEVVNYVVKRIDLDYFDEAI